jgi:hypothetical protein
MSIAFDHSRRPRPGSEHPFYETWIKQHAAYLKNQQDAELMRIAEMAKKIEPKIEDIQLPVGRANIYL